MDDLLAEFLQETEENLVRLEPGLAGFVQSPDDPHLLQTLHTFLHTITSTTAFLNLPQLENLAQAADAVIVRMRRGEIAMSPPFCEPVVQAIDRIKDILAHLKATETEPTEDHEHLVDGLSHLAQTGTALPEIGTVASVLQDNTRDAGEPVDTGFPAAPELIRPEDDTVRVSADALQNMLRMVSELVTTRNQLVDILRSKGDRDVDGPLHRLIDVTSDLRNSVLQNQQLPVLPALIVDCAGHRFAVPHQGIAEVVSIGGPTEPAIETVKGAVVMPLGDQVLPLVELGSVLDLADVDQDAPRTHGAILVVEGGARRFGLMVDAVLNTEDILVEPVAPMIESIPYYCGSAQLENGRSAMVLQAAAFEPDRMDSSDQETPAIGNQPTAFLLIRAGDEVPRAVPLSQVLRLEEVDLQAVVGVDDGMSVPYRESALPLLPLGGEIGEPKQGVKPVLVLAADDRQVGLIVDQVFDIVEARINLLDSPTHPGILGTAILAGTVTEIIDTDYYLRHRMDHPTPEALAIPDTNGGKYRSGRQRLLLVDDSAYIRNLLAPVLTVSGYDVIPAASADEAIDICAGDPTVDLIVVDVDLPDKAGLDLVKFLRNDPRWSDLPIIAVSTRLGPADMQQGHEAGFTDYIDKYNRDGLLQALSELSY